MISGIGHTTRVQVPCEEAVVEIRERYLELNSHAKSYTFKALVRTSPETPDFTFEVSEQPLERNRTGTLGTTLPARQDVTPALSLVCMMCAATHASVVFIVQ
jgi:hypothetical protein